MNMAATLCRAFLESLEMMDMARTIYKQARRNFPRAPRLSQGRKSRGGELTAASTRALKYSLISRQPNIQRVSYGRLYGFSLRGTYSCR